jgi:hypothetical protein
MTKIELYLYDLFPTNDAFRFLGLGAYHTGVVVDGSVEYWFGAGPDDNVPGIQTTSHPGTTGPELYEIIEIGTTGSSLDTIEVLVTAWRGWDRWFGSSHNLLYHNCNTFSFEFCVAILGKDNVGRFPRWIQRFERMARFVFSCSLAPTVYLGPWKFLALGTAGATGEGAGEVLYEAQLDDALLPGHAYA